MRIGVVQPEAKWGRKAPEMLADALQYVAEAGRSGVDLLVFPETYPGPTTHTLRYSVIEPLCEMAAKHGVALAVGTTEKAPGGERSYYVSCIVIDTDGEVVGSYRRTHPRGPYYAGIYAGGPFWDIDYVEGDSLPVFDLSWGKLAVVMCSEVFVPEVARAMALEGAEVCIFPTGIMIDDMGFTENWQTLVRARAIENIMYTATTMNLFREDLRQAHVKGALPPIDEQTGLNSGHAMICGPEKILGLMRGPGILTADLDLERLRKMRQDPEFPDGVTFPPPYSSLPGLANLRRPELAGRLVAASGKPPLTAKSMDVTAKQAEVKATI